MKRSVIVLMVAMSAACLSELQPDVGPVIAGRCENEDSDPEVDVSFKDEVLPMISMGCGCHDPAKSGSAIDSSGYSIANYRDITKGGNKSAGTIVVAGDACNSVLVQKCSEAPPFGARMPISGPYFTRAEMNLLRDWIVEGANDN